MLGLPGVRVVERSEANAVFDEDGVRAEEPGVVLGVGALGAATRRESWTVLGDDGPVAPIERYLA